LRKFIYNEYDLAEQFYKIGLDKGNFLFWQVALLAKYLRDTGLGETRMEESLYVACESAYKDFNRTKRMKTIGYAVKQGMKFRLRKVGNVVITTEEVEGIMKVEGFVKRKFLLILLCYSKILKYTTAKRDVDDEYPKMHGYYVGNKYVWEIIQTAHISISKRKVMREWLYEFHRLGLIDGIAGEMNSIKVLYADDESYPLFEIDVKDKADILLKCNMYLADDKCLRCGGKFVRRNLKNQRQKYCDECSKIIKNEQAKVRMENLRKKKTG
jgi:hypothetical protein